MGERKWEKEGEREIEEKRAKGEDIRRNNIERCTRREREERERKNSGRKSVGDRRRTIEIEGER